MSKIILLSALLWSGVAVAAEISGLIRQADGNPVAGATIQVSTARLRTGSSPMCPSCWADCAKSAKTDTAGTFYIPNVSDSLVFRVLVLADGFAPCYVDHVDPSVGPAEATLQSRDLSSFPDAQLIKGRISGDDGRPIAGASITPVIRQDGLDSAALTNLEGEFTLASSKKIKKGLLEIRATGYATVKVESPGSNGAPKPVNVKLGRGVLITGRVLQHGIPVPGVTMAASQINRDYHSFVDSVEAVTGENGAFQIRCVPPKDKIALYGTMESLASKGATTLRVIDTGADDSIGDVGDLEIQMAGALNGWFHITDGRSLPPETRIILSREKAWDAVVVPVSADGRFSIHGIPLGEAFNLSLPRDYDVQAVSTGFTVDELNDELHGSLAVDLSDLKVDLVWKDAKAREGERFAARIRKQFGDFFESAKLTPDQAATFISIKRDAMKVWEDACQQIEVPPGILIEEFEARELTGRLGEKFCASFLQHERLKWGKENLDRFVSLHEGPWLDEVEKMRLAPLVAVELDKTTKYWRAHYWTQASPEEKTEVTKRMYDGVYAACANALPPPKLKILRECLDICQVQEMEEIRKEGKDK